MHRQALMGLAAAVVVWGVAVESPARDQDFALSKLAAPGDILGLTPVDLDCDSLRDIVIVHKKGVPPNESRWVSVFWQSREGTYGTAPDQSWECRPRRRTCGVSWARPAWAARRLGRPGQTSPPRP